jgi:hypothetical protein
MDKTIRIIKEYDLIELSLVDNPANQFANILSVQKVDGVDVIKGDSLDTEFENVFWDNSNGIVKVSDSDVEVSPIDGTPMKNIGFVEKNDNEKTEMIKFLVDSAKGINLSKMTKEEDPMNETTEDVVKNDDVVEEAKVAPEADTTTEDTVEKSYSEDKTMEEKSMDEETVKSEDMDEDDVNGDSDPEEEMDKAADKQKSVEEVSKSEDVVAAAVAEIRDGITTAFSDLTSVVKSLNDEIADLKKSLGLVNAKLNDAESDFNNIGKRIDAVEADTAFRKSGDLGEIVQEQPAKQVEKSLWGGRFLKTADLFN